MTKPCGFCHDRPVGNARRWTDPAAPRTAACPRCGIKRELSPLDRLRAEATDLGMDPAQAGRYVEDGLAALDAAAEEAAYLEREAR